VCRYEVREKTRKVVEDMSRWIEAEFKGESGIRVLPLEIRLREVADL